MKGGHVLAFFLAVATVVLIAVGTLWPNQSGSGVVDASGQWTSSGSNAENAVNGLLHKIAQRDWQAAYASLANKSEFTEAEFIRDLTGDNRSLRTYATLDGYDIRSLRATSSEGDIRASLRWASVVGTFRDSRDLRVTKNDGRWQVAWPVVKEPRVPPQVIPVNYLRWDVIYRGPDDDWGAQDVEGPHVRIVAMRPISRDGGVIVMGEILNEDVVPAFVTVKAALLDRAGAVLASGDSFDKISHTLLPKQVSPFRIDFPDVSLSQVDSVRMQPDSSLVGASADPIIAIEDQKLSPVPDASLSGNLVNQSGQTVNVAHVLGTFYDNKGQIIWVADEYPNRALLPETPEAFVMPLPADISNKVTSYHVVTSTYTASRFQ